jgi:hypothetical protein
VLHSVLDQSLRFIDAIDVVEAEHSPLHDDELTEPLPCGKEVRYPLKPLCHSQVWDTMRLGLHEERAEMFSYALDWLHPI